MVNTNIERERDRGRLEWVEGVRESWRVSKERKEDEERHYFFLPPEFQSSVQNDDHRIQQMFCSLAVSGHPLSNFPWGEIEKNFHIMSSWYYQYLL